VNDIHGMYIRDYDVLENLVHQRVIVPIPLQSMFRCDIFSCKYGNLYLHVSHCIDVMAYVFTLVSNGNVRAHLLRQSFAVDHKASMPAGRSNLSGHEVIRGQVACILADD